jgi:hypothetical protein
MSLDSPFREKAKGFTSVRAFSDAKDLYFQNRPLDVFPEMRLKTPSIRSTSINGA